ncbi:MAG TPA: DUF362 domain-containing protein, partial [Syntrophobacteraceae bacterium]|nr:DUF362 domain-containing protein [Syntrophobacteraceae bacterium]
NRLFPFPKWGVVSTSRVIGDMVYLLKERGIDHISIGEGTVAFDPKERKLTAHAFQALGYGVLEKRYGVKCIDILERPFQKVDLGGGVRLSINTDILNSDFVVNVPVLKTHSQTVVSLGIKNLKGMLDIRSRKKCHSADPETDLHYMVSRLVRMMPPSFTIIDGIFANEQGPFYDGRIRRSNILVSSADVLSADKVGATILGHQPSQVPHLVHAATDMKRTLDLTDLEIFGEKIENVALSLRFDFPYTEDGGLPTAMAKLGIKGLTYRKYDLSLCTYCSWMTGSLLKAIAYAWAGEPWDDVEILTGKIMKPTPGRKHTILLGKCMYEANKNNPDLKNMIAVKTCPPDPEALVKTLHRVGIQVNPEILEFRGRTAGSNVKPYENKPEFDESFFRIETN